MKYIKFKNDIQICCTPEIAFDLTQDYDERLSWDTFLKKAELIDGSNEAGKGVKAYCVSKYGLGMVTEYISFNRPRTTAIKMTKGPYMFRTFIGSWTFKELDDNLTNVTFMYSFQLRFPFTFFSQLIKRNMKSNVEQRLRDLKQKIEN